MRRDDRDIYIICIHLEIINHFHILFCHLLSRENFSYVWQRLIIVHFTEILTANVRDHTVLVLAMQWVKVREMCAP